MNIDDCHISNYGSNIGLIRDKTQGHMHELNNCISLKLFHMTHLVNVG